MTKTYQFGIVLNGMVNHTIETASDALFEAGCDDGLIVFDGHLPCVEFDREAESYEAAIFSAIADVRRAGFEPIQVTPDDRVAPAEIARRARVSREAVRLWIEGLRGGGFPGARGVMGKSKFWSWLEVAQWLQVNERGGADDVHVAAVLAAVNLRLALSQAQKTPGFKELETHFLEVERSFAL